MDFTVVATSFLEELAPFYTLNTKSKEGMPLHSILLFYSLLCSITHIIIILTSINFLSNVQVLESNLFVKENEWDVNNLKICEQIKRERRAAKGRVNKNEGG